MVAFLRLGLCVSRLPSQDPPELFISLGPERSEQSRKVPAHVVWNLVGCLEEQRKDHILNSTSAVVTAPGAQFCSS